MKNKLMRLLSALTCLVLFVSFTAMPASAGLIPIPDGYVYSCQTVVLDEDQIAKAEEYIAANDRAGLYDYLRFDVNKAEIDSEGGVLSWNHRLEYLTTGYTDTYILDDDERYNMVIEHFVYFDGYFYNFPSEWVLNPGDSTLYGDVNKDYRVSITDVIMLNKMAAGIISVNDPEQALLADVDWNCRINNNDLTILLQYVVNEIDSVPAKEYYG